MTNYKNFTDKEYEFVKTLFQVTQDELKDWLYIHLKELYSKERVVHSLEYVYAVGDIPVCLVAHMDTVHRFAPTDIYYDREQSIMWSPQGLGADDRAGVFSILYLLWKGYRPHVLFTTDEEIGGVGAQAAATNLNPDLNFVIQLDRRGSDDSVFYDLDNPEFEDFINDFGFITATGSFSDISYLCPEWKVAGVNFSIGYEHEHTNQEILNVNNMFRTIERVRKILDSDLSDKKFEYKEIPHSSSYMRYVNNNWGNFLGSGGGSRKDVAYETRKTGICYECFNTVDEELLIETEEGSYCGDCYARHYTTCISCHKSFRDSSKTHLKCKNCRTIKEE